MPIKRVIFKKLIKVFLLFVIIFLISSLLIFSIGEEEGPTTSYNIENPKDLENLIKNGGSGKGTFSQPQTINLPNGQTAIVSGNVEVEGGEIAYADNMEYQGGNLRNVRGFRATEDGYTASSVGQLKQDDVVITNGIGVSFSSGILMAKHVDSLVRSGSVTTNIDNLEVNTQFFSVEKADSLVSSGVTVSSIENTEFTINVNDIAMKPKKGSTLHISGKSYIETDFEAFSDDSEVKVSKDKSEYEIKNGRLNYSTNEYTDSVESNSTAKIEIDGYGFGFRCMKLGIKSTYWYYDKKDLRKDFGVNVPDYGNGYKLCIRRIGNTKYDDYDGLIDFIERNIFLNGIVNYLRYPLKNNQIASLLSDFVYRGLKNVKTLLNYDENLLFLKNIGIKNVLENEQQITITKPNNYFTIKEIELEDGKIHRVVELNIINKNQLTQDIDYNYESDSLNSKIIISNNILVQDNGKNRITILPLEHPKISSFIG